VPTVVFDFDSTLIDCESLDEILSRVLAGRPEVTAQVRAITDRGMEGLVPFRESVESRLRLARPTLVQVRQFGEEAVAHITAGMAGLVARLRERGDEVWIVTGGLIEAVAPVAHALSIPASRVLATHARWSAAGELEGLARCTTKVEAAREVAGGWPRPRTGVGDGMTDHALLAAGLVDRFVAFTQHARRAAVVATGAPEARSVPELEYLLAGS